jgi:hypothetical protein
MFGRKTRRAAIAAVLAAGLAVGGTAAASAATSGGTPKPHHHVFLRPEQFDISLVSVGAVNVNDVEATGPVTIAGGTDQELSSVLGTFTSTPGNLVRVHHQDLPLPVIDTFTCTALFDQNDAPWYFRGSTGTFAGAFGFGLYDLRGVVSFPDKVYRHKAVCPLDGLTPWQVRRDIESNSPTQLPAPTLVSFEIQGAGVAALPVITKV